MQSFELLMRIYPGLWRSESLNHTHGAGERGRGVVLVPRALLRRHHVRGKRLRPVSPHPPHFSPQTLNLTRRTFNPQPYALHPEPYTLNPNLPNLNLEPSTLHLEGLVTCCPSPLAQVPRGAPYTLHLKL